MWRHTLDLTILYYLGPPQQSETLFYCRFDAQVLAPVFRIAFAMYRRGTTLTFYY
jgi:hypothetical protein